MSPLESPAVRHRPLPATDERLHGEKLSVSSTEDSSPLKRGFLYGALQCKRMSVLSLIADIIGAISHRSLKADIGGLLYPRKRSILTHRIYDFTPLRADGGAEGNLAGETLDHRFKGV